MKKLLSLLLCIILLCAGMTAAQAEEEIYQCGGFEYALLDDGSAELIRYTGNADHVIIPNELDGHLVLSVRQNPFVFYSENTHQNVSKKCTVAVAMDHPYLATLNGVLFGKSDKKLIAYPAVFKSSEITRSAIVPVFFLFPSPTASLQSETERSMAAPASPPFPSPTVSPASGMVRSKSAPPSNLLHFLTASILSIGLLSPTAQA